MPKPYRYPWSLVYFLQPSYYKMNKDIIECLTSRIKGKKYLLSKKLKFIPIN